VNPGIPIPESATSVHGVTDEQAATGLPPEQALSEIDSALQSYWAKGIPVTGFNVSYDLTLLDRELRRHLGRPLTIAGPVLDGLVLDKAVDKYRRGSRKLTSVCEHYGVALDNAHAADADALAASLVTREIVNNHLAGFGLSDLHDRQVLWFKDQRRSFISYLARKGEVPSDTNTAWPVAPFDDSAQEVAA